MGLGLATDLQRSGGSEIEARPQRGACETAATARMGDFMPRFLTRTRPHDVIPDGVYVFKVGEKDLEHKLAEAAKNKLGREPGEKIHQSRSGSAERRCA